MLRKLGVLTLLLGLVAVTSATYSTETPVRYIDASENCPAGCFCVTSDNKDNLMEVVCPTKETANIIEGAPPKDIEPSDVIDVESFMQTSNTDAQVDSENDLKENPPASTLDEQPVEDQVSEVPLVFDDKLEQEPAVSSKVEPDVDEDSLNNFTFAPVPVEEEQMQGDQPADVSEEEDFEIKPTEEPEKPLVFDDLPEQEPVVKAEPEVKDDFENFTFAPEPVEDEQMQGDEPSDVSEEATTPAPTQVADIAIKPSASADPTNLELRLDDNVTPSPTAEPTEEESLFSSEEEEVAPSVAPRAITASPSPEVTAKLEPITFEPEPVNVDVDSNESAEVVPAPTSPEVPLVFNDAFTSAAPEVVREMVPDDVEDIDDVLKPEPATESPESSSSPLPAIVPKVIVDVETNQLDETLTSEDLILANDHAEMSGKIENGEEPGVSEAPQQSTASWVILGLILAMFVGVLLYAAIKGRLEGGQNVAPKVPSVSSAVAATSEFTKNRRPSGDEGTELKEMSKALLGSPLEDRVSRYIDEEDVEQMKRLFQQEEDEILEQVVVEPQELSLVNNAVEKPPRKFIHVPPPVVPGKGSSSPNTPTLVRAKVVDLPSDVHYVVGNGNSTPVDK